MQVILGLGPKVHEHSLPTYLQVPKQFFVGRLLLMSTYGVVPKNLQELTFRDASGIVAVLALAR